MSSRELSLWLDERRWQALDDALALQCSSIEDHMTRYLLDLYERMVPEEEYEKVEEAIRKESEEAAAQREADRRFSLARITEDSKATVLLLERGENLFSTAQRLRQYLRGKSAYPEVYPAAAVLTQDRAEQYVAEAVNGSPRVVGVYDIDLDKGELSALDINYGWHTYQIKDLSTAVYHATRKESASWPVKRQKFYDEVEGMDCNPTIRPVYIRGAEPLPMEAVSFESDISEMDGRFLNFYVPVHFDPDSVFGTHVGTSENDDWVNVYANYDMEQGCVEDTLWVTLVRGDSTELCCQYRLSPEEQAALLPKMDAYCKAQTGMGLEECRELYLAEQASVPRMLPPQMNQGQTM